MFCLYSVKLRLYALDDLSSLLGILYAYNFFNKQYVTWFFLVGINYVKLTNKNGDLTWCSFCASQMRLW
jgi:hypothetical protein